MSCLFCRRLRTFQWAKNWFLWPAARGRNFTWEENFIVIKR